MNWALWRPGISFSIYGTDLPLQDLARDAVLILTALVSLWLTPNEHRDANGFSWEPILEVITSQNPKTPKPQNPNNKSLHKRKLKK